MLASGKTSSAVMKPARAGKGGTWPSWAGHRPGAGPPTATPHGKFGPFPVCASTRPASPGGLKCTPRGIFGQLKVDTRWRLSYRSYCRFLMNLTCPVYMQQTFPAIPGSVRYPLEQALRTFGRCFTSTASYMIALAIMEGCDTIGVWAFS